DVQIIDSGEAVAKQTKNILSQNKLLNTGEKCDLQPEFYTNIDPKVLSEIIEADKHQYRVSRMEF
ncbi:MAG: glutamate racemase, partial [Gramella sp.]|nr:glutamate racemase [Christiangramia sp.]